MDKQTFIDQFQTASESLDEKHIDKVISYCLDRCGNLYPQYERGHMNLVSTMEECAEFVQALSKRMRGREENNFELLEEIADVYLSVLCVAEILGISREDIAKAINVKADREEKRILEHFGWSELSYQRPAALEGPESTGFTLPDPFSSTVVTGEDIDDILESAMSGCTYWCERVDPVGSYCGDFANEQISRDGELLFFPMEDPVAWLNKEKFKMGLFKWLLALWEADPKHFANVVTNNQIDPGQIDAGMADAIIQYALFDDIIYA